MARGYRFGVVGSLSLVPDGSTVLPTDDITIWLKCGRRSETYTSLSQVLADSTCLGALIADNNAVNYMVRSTTWASTVCADSGAMTLIGGNNYCANTLLDNSTWRNAICNSAYAENVLNSKVPTMTSNTTPSGVCAASENYTGYDPYKAFDGNNSTAWYANANSSTNQWISYDFGFNITVAKIRVRPEYPASQSRLKDINIQYSDDNSTWNGSNNYVVPNVNQDNDFILNDIGSHRYWRMYVADNYTTYNIGCSTLQFYGRKDV